MENCRSPFPSFPVPAFASCSGLDLLGLLDRLVDAADHVERLLGDVVAFAVDDHLEAADGVLQRHVLARRTGEHLGHVEGLAEEALDLARARHGLLVFLAQLVHAQDRDDVLELLVRSEEHTSELQSLMRISYAVFCLKKKKNTQNRKIIHKQNNT